MSDGLQVDSLVLRRAGHSLRAVYGEFEQAERTADVGRVVVAHDRLRDRLAEFGAGWNTARAELMQAIEGLGDAAEGAAEAYERIETELTAALAGEK